MSVYRSKVFRAGNSGAVRLPKDVTPGTDVEVEIIKQGEVLTIRPVRQRMTPRELVAALEALPKPPWCASTPEPRTLRCRCMA